MTKKPKIKQPYSPEDKAIGERLFKELMKSIDKHRLKAAAQLSRKLSKTFRSVCPSMDPELRGSIIARLVDVIDESDEIRKDVGKIARLTRRSEALRLGSLLKDIQVVRLDHLRRHLAGLRRDIPRSLSILTKSKGRQLRPQGRFDKVLQMIEQSDEPSQLHKRSQRSNGKRVGEA